MQILDVSAQSLNLLLDAWSIHELGFSLHDFPRSDFKGHDAEHVSARCEDLDGLVAWHLDREIHVDPQALSFNARKSCTDGHVLLREV